jgi:hypothetical protein
MERILEVKYGPEIIHSLCQLPISKTIWQRLQWWQQKDNIVFDCLRDYCSGMVWKVPTICWICGLLRQKMVNISVTENNFSSPNLSILQVKDHFITDVSLFQYGLSVLNGIVLESAGFKVSDKGQKIMQICNDYQSALTQTWVPHFALANYLYQRKLPDEFHDLTWVEEMVCAKYCNMAHITHIYGSSDPSQPKIFYGNTCAHKMNVISTASVLPWMPADINDLLSVVFVGSEKFNLNCLWQLFRICKWKVWNFLSCLTTHNCLYRDIALNNSLMDLYPEDNSLSGIDNCVFEDYDTDADHTLPKKHQVSQIILLKRCWTSMIWQHHFCYWKEWAFLTLRVQDCLDVHLWLLLWETWCPLTFLTLSYFF